MATLDSTPEDNVMRLNKFVAQSGICTRRKAVDLVKSGAISINGQVETNPFYELKADDKVTHQGHLLEKKEDFVYVLLNKPKNTISTINETNGRPNVYELVKKTTDIAVSTISDLSIHDLGLMVLTNDKTVLEKLGNAAHPMKIVLQITVDKPINNEQLNKLKEILTQSPIFGSITGIEHVNGQEDNVLGITLKCNDLQLVHSFFKEHKYVINKMDRVYFAGLTKKDLPRGWSRTLSEKEVIIVKHLL